MLVAESDRSQLQPAFKVLNYVFGGLIIAAVLCAAFSGTMPQVTAASLASSKTSVELALGLIGQMGLWLGLMGILNATGATQLLSRLVKPVMVRLFPEVPAESPAMSAMVLNIAANMLGLDNAATPFGLKAMHELKKLSPTSSAANNAMALFLTINTAGISVIPVRAIAVRATLGSVNPAGVLLPSFLSSVLSAALAMLLCKLFERIPVFAKTQPPLQPAAFEATPPVPPLATALKRNWPFLLVAAVLGVTLTFALAREASVNSKTPFEFFRNTVSEWTIPLLMVAIVTVGLGQKAKPYEVFVEAAKEGFTTAITIIPYLLAILVPVSMFRASGGMDLLVSLLSPLTQLVGFPAEALPVALVRPLSGSGALAVMTETMKTYGPDSFIGNLVSLVCGSSETTFYVLAVYFGAVQIKAVRHTLLACLVADTVGLFVSLIIARLFF
jgi:spore maturation protein SpmA